MSKYTIWHNPKCSKSRQTYELLKEKEVEIEERIYIENAPSIEELKMLVQSLNVSPSEIVRKKDDFYKELNIDESSMTDEKWIELLHKNSRLIERPIVIHEGKAVIGRPPENIEKLF